MTAVNTVATRRELREQLDRMPPDQQRQVLDFAKALAVRAEGESWGQSLTRYAGAIPEEDLTAIAQAIEEGRERIDRDEW